MVLAAAAIATRYFVLSQYYVGVGQDEEVVIYRGVPGSILGIDLHTYEEGSCPPSQVCTDKLRVNQLQEDARLAVQHRHDLVRHRRIHRPRPCERQYLPGVPR